MDPNSASESGRSDNSGGPGNEGPNEETALPDSDQDNSQNKEVFVYYPGHDLGCYEGTVEYDNINDIPSKKIWGSLLR